MKRLLFLFLPLMLVMSSCKGYDRGEDDSSNRCSCCGKKSYCCIGQPPKCIDCFTKKKCSRCGKIDCCTGQPPKCSDCSFPPTGSNLPPLPPRFPTFPSSTGHDFLVTKLDDKIWICSCCHKKCSKLHQPGGRCSNCLYKQKCSYCGEDYNNYEDKNSANWSDRCLKCRYKQKCSLCSKEYGLTLDGQSGKCPDCLMKKTCSHCGKSDRCTGQPPKCGDCSTKETWKKTCSRCGKWSDCTGQPPKCIDCCFMADFIGDVRR